MASRTSPERSLSLPQAAAAATARVADRTATLAATAADRTARMSAAAAAAARSPKRSGSGSGSGSGAGGSGMLRGSSRSGGLRHHDDEEVAAMVHGATGGAGSARDSRKDLASAGGRRSPDGRPMSSLSTGSKRDPEAAEARRKMKELDAIRAKLAALDPAKIAADFGIPASALRPASASPKSRAAPSTPKTTGGSRPGAASPMASSSASAAAAAAAIKVDTSPSTMTESTASPLQLSGRLAGAASAASLGM